MGFKISISKSKAMIFSNKHHKGELKKLKLEVNALDYVKHFLGLRSNF